MNRRYSITAIVVGAIFLGLCFLVLCVVAAGVGLFAWNVQRSSGPLTFGSTPTATPVVIRPTPLATFGITTSTLQPQFTLPPQVTPVPADTQEATPSVSQSQEEETLKTLEDTIVPINDLYDIASRLEGKENIPHTLPPPATPFQVGAKQQFWVSNTDNNQNFQVPATLRYITDHSYFWVEDGVRYNQQALQNLAETFENKIYPTDRAFFGSEWTPGVDGDPHIYILYARGLGENIAGYYSSVDEYNPAVEQYSNGHEMFDFNADNTDLSDPFTYGVLAHEFQHMIHWNGDRNETSWLNEGFSDLAMFLNGYTVGGQDFLFAKNPDLQLNDWPNDRSQVDPHYGASFLFLNYFLDRFGEKATRAVVADPANGLDSIDHVLTKLGTTDPLTGKPIRADDVFLDWVLATHLQDSTIPDGRYTYHLYKDAPQTGFTETIRNCNSDFQTRDVHQYGADIIRLQCNGDVALNFEGSTQVSVVPVNPHSGSFAFWSNKGDDSDMTLTRTFDFTNVSGSISMDYWTWYDLEKDYDYVYLEASQDGTDWQILKPPSCSTKNITGNNYGCGYSGTSGSEPQWIQESVDLSKYAGEKVRLRFEYITDAAVNGEGFLLDDISVPQINYSCDFETDNCGWEPNGWVRVENSLPQTFRLALIKQQGNTTTVEQIPLAADNTAKIPLNFGSGLDEATLVVTGTTRFTRQEAAYRFFFTP
jgi:immune inhibitor A